MSLLTSSKNEVLSLDQAQRCLAALAGLSYRGRTLADYLRTLCVQLTELFGGGLAAVTLYRDGSKQVLAVAPGEADLCTLYNPQGEISTHVVESEQPLRLADGREDTRFGVMPEGYTSYMGVPLVPPHGAVIGTVCYFDAIPRRFSDAELNVALLFAERAATAVDNFHLYQRLTEFNHQLEQQVTERTAQLHAVQEQLLGQARLAAVGEFASAITHEIRSPLSTIRLNLDFLSRLSLPDTGQRRLRLAQDEAQRLERLLSEVLAVAKPAAMNLILLDLVEFLPTALASLREDAVQRDLRFDLSLPDAPAWVNADRDKLMQVVVNLTRNACEAAPSGTVVYWSVEQLAPSPTVRFSVRNAGELIPAAVLPRLTEPFFTTKPQGTGLGLMVVKSIVGAHGGELAITSNEQHGTVVSVSLPRCAP